MSRITVGVSTLFLFRGLHSLSVQPAFALYPTFWCRSFRTTRLVQYNTANTVAKKTFKTLQALQTHSFSAMSSNEDNNNNNNNNNNLLSRKRKAEQHDEAYNIDNDQGMDQQLAPKTPTEHSKHLSRQEAKANHTRRRNMGIEHEVHAGSYASEAQRQLFGVELPPEEDPAVTATRQKRKVAFLLGYLGTDYGGFQINDEKRTLQGDFELALLRCHFLMRSNFGYPFKYAWSTSGRTDKGVHACAQVTSAKIEILPDQSMDDVRDALNHVLPDDIRVLDVKRTTRSFCAHTQRDRVRYQYMIPSFVLGDIGQIRAMFEAIGAPKNGRPWSDPLSEEEIAQVYPQFKTYRATPAQLDLLHQALQCYSGTHSFHNFTKGIKASEARAMRFIEYFRVEDPVVIDGVEWVPTQVLGQSFLIHQIRKMVCMAMDVARGAAPVDTISRALSKESDVRVSTAPAQGLYLDMSFYGGYNRRKSTNPDLPDLDWTDEASDEFKRWKEFRNGIVMKHVVEEEAREGNFVKHLYLQEFGSEYRKHYQLEESDETTKELVAEAKDN